MAEFITCWVGSWTGHSAHVYPSIACCTVWESNISGIHFLWVLRTLWYPVSPVQMQRKLLWLVRDLKFLSWDFNWDLFQFKGHGFYDWVLWLVSWVTWSIPVSGPSEFPDVNKEAVGLDLVSHESCFPRGRSQFLSTHHSQVLHTCEVFNPNNGSMRNRTSVPVQHQCTIILLSTLIFF